MIEKSINDMSLQLFDKIRVRYGDKGEIVLNQWQLINKVTTEEHNQIKALAHVPADSMWFSGHFPGEPIIPGIALIHMVEQAIIRDAENRNEKIQLIELKRVRFTGPVRPEDDLSLVITYNEASEVILYSFKITCKEASVCSGLLAAGKLNKINK